MWFQGEEGSYRVTVPADDVQAVVAELRVIMA